MREQNENIKTKYVYHYKARFEMYRIPKIDFSDHEGLFINDRKIANSKDYIEFRNSVWDQIKQNGIDSIFEEKDMRICSLSFLHEVEQEK